MPQRHGPWNLVWRAKLPAAIIDFDNAAPGTWLDDLGYAAWKHLNLGLVDLPVSEQRRRLKVLAEGYGARLENDWLSAMHDAQAGMRQLIETAPASHQRAHAVAQISREQQWLQSHGAELIA